MRATLAAALPAVAGTAKAHVSVHSTEPVRMLVAMLLGAALALAAQWLARRLLPSRKLRQAWREGNRPQDSYRVYQGLIVPDARGTTEVDEVCVTPAGVYVIEKKDFGAWIYGHEADEQWTAVYANGEKHRFQNPIRQNYRHVKALEAHLKLPESVLFSLVVFSRRARFRTEMPRQVIGGRYLDYIRWNDRVGISPEQFDTICASLDALAAQSGRESLEKHVDNLHKQFSDPNRCPRCDGQLVKRQSRKPGNEHNFFLGCSNYPRCRYVRSLDG